MEVKEDSMIRPLRLANGFLKVDHGGGPPSPHRPRLTLFATVDSQTAMLDNETSLFAFASFVQFRSEPKSRFKRRLSVFVVRLRRLRWLFGFVLVHAIQPTSERKTGRHVPIKNGQVWGPFKPLEMAKK